ncbi:MAG: hypothetical protein Q9M27_02805 [Mariprofundaceae bacterium]|nr:hypothetical protein [Mariprofundaceae bacterium]
MAESGNGKVAKEEQDLVDHPASGVDTSVQEPSPENMDIPAEEIPTQSSSHAIRWLALLLIIAALPLGWFLAPEDTRQKWTDMLASRPPPQNISHVDVAPAPQAQAEVPAPTVVASVSRSADPEAGQPASHVPQAVAPVVVAPHAAPTSDKRKAPQAVTSEEVRVLMATMGELQGHMQALQDTQTELHRELIARQQLELRTRLRWIASTRTLLPQMTDFWQDIALLPLLSKNERREAEVMRKLAANDADKLNAWGVQLKRLAATLPVPLHQDIIPKPEQPAFSWLAGKFHLRPVPTSEQQKLSELRARLLEAAHLLSVEIWPEPKVWRRLLADLREQFGDDADLSLPEHPGDIQKDIATMHAKAANWLEQLRSISSLPLSEAGN